MWPLRKDVSLKIIDAINNTAMEICHVYVLADEEELGIQFNHVSVSFQSTTESYETCRVLYRSVYAVVVKSAGSSDMVLALAIGDFHIPHRAPEISESFKAMLVPGRIQHILCTGNLCAMGVEDFLRSISPDVSVVAGDMDVSTERPAKSVVNIESLSVGLCHGHQVTPWGDEAALETLRREMGVDILVSGHTHELQIRQGTSGGLFINPGSATGAPSMTGRIAPNPSFVLIDVQGSLVDTYSYVLEGKDVKVESMSYGRIK